MRLAVKPAISDGYTAGHLSDDTTHKQKGRRDAASFASVTETISRFPS
jgi:hypothetical protein